MNWLLLVVIIFLLFYTYRGYHNGFIKTVCSIVAVGVALIIASTIGPMVGNMVDSNTGIYTFVDDKVKGMLNIPETSVTTGDQVNLIEQLPLPDSMKEALIENNYDGMYENLSVSSFGGYVSGFITRLIINAVAYILVFVVALIAVYFIGNFLDLISKLPILNGMNKVAGLLTGFIHGMMLVWIWCIVLMIFSGTSVGQVLFQQINSSMILSFIYNNNLFISLFMGLVRVMLVIV